MSKSASHENCMALPHLSRVDRKHLHGLFNLLTVCVHPGLTDK